MHYRSISGALLFLLILFLPLPLFADAIDFPILIVHGLLYFIPVALFTVFAEAFIIGRILSVRYKTAALFSLFANILSFLAGIPLLVLNSFLYTFVPKDLYLYFQAYLIFSIVSYIVYLLFTVLIEWLWAMRWKRRGVFKADTGKILKAVIIANVVTYIIICPLCYFKTMPRKYDVADFTAATGWAQKPVTKVIYIDNKTGYLKQINTDGSDEKVIVTFPVKDYLMTADFEAFLFRGTDNNLYYCQPKKEYKIKVWDTSDKFLMSQVGISPSKTKVAYLKKTGRHYPFRLVVYDLATNAAIETNYSTGEKFFDTDVEVAWSEQENILYVKEGKQINQVSFDNKPDVTIIRDIKPADIKLCNDYGRFSDGHWWGG